jgi:hypothetical protein
MGIGGAAACVEAGGAIGGGERLAGVPAPGSGGASPCSRRTHLNISIQPEESTTTGAEVTADILCAEGWFSLGDNRPVPQVIGWAPNPCAPATTDHQGWRCGSTGCRCRRPRRTQARPGVIPPRRRKPSPDSRDDEGSGTSPPPRTDQVLQDLREFF